ncbi:MAG: hypothetical protein PUD34_04740 [bacterium]|nr:hypothetical protein [bacterium]
MNELELPKKKEKTEIKAPAEEKSLTLKELIKEVWSFLTKADITNIVKFIIELILIALVIIVGKLPFELIIDLGPKIFNIMGDSNILKIALKIWDLILNILYALLGIYAYFKICSTRFVNLTKRLTNSNK